MPDQVHRFRPRLAEPLSATVSAPPNEAGEFPAALGTVGRPLFLRLDQPTAVRPVVIDSNVLRGDLLHPLRPGFSAKPLDALVDLGGAIEDRGKAAERVKKYHVVRHLTHANRLVVTTNDRIRDDLLGITGVRPWS